MNPIFHWVGGKRWLSPSINPIIYQNLKGKYIEPFFGSGAIFFGLQRNIRSATLCDIIAPLMNTYREIKENPLGVSRSLQEFRSCTLSQSYYEIMRDKFNIRFTNPIGGFTQEDAALFLFINKSCFNGLWRQNKDGLFNVPYGKHTKIILPSTADLIKISERLHNTSLITINEPYDIFSYIEQAEQGDVIFADPPYYSVYDQYDGFTCSFNIKEFHAKLAAYLYEAYSRNVTVITTNIDDPFIRSLYSHFCQIEQFVRWQVVAAQSTDRKQWKQIVMTAIPQI